MATTNAQRQAAYRRRARHKDSRLSVWVNTSAALALARLARHDGVSQRQVIERLITQADDAVYAGLELDSPEWAAYSGVTA